MVKYYNKIDGLRCVAIVVVLIEHFAFFLGKRFSAGYYGVDLFFVISGFLITSILLKPKGSFWHSYKNFIGRRTLRIFPIYYLTILVLYIANFSIIRQCIFYFLTYTYNYAWVYYSIPDTPVNHFWSLCVEEQFYLIWPFIVILLRNKMKWLMAVVICLIIIGFSQMTFNIIPSMNEYNLISLLTRMASLSMGALGAILHQTGRMPDKLLRNRYFELVLFPVLLFSLITDLPIKYFLMACCSLALILKCVHSDFRYKFINTFLTHRWSIFIGTISYGIYIYHLPLSEYLNNYVFNPVWFSIPFNKFGRLSVIQWNSWVIKFPLYSALSIGLAYCSYRYIERPLLSLKDRWFKN